MCVLRSYSQYTEVFLNTVLLLLSLYTVYRDITFGSEAGSLFGFSQIGFGTVTQGLGEKIHVQLQGMVHVYSLLL